MKPIGSFSPYNKKHDTGIPINGKDEAPRSQGRSDYNRIVERMSSDVNDDGKGGSMNQDQTMSIVSFVLSLCCSCMIVLVIAAIAFLGPKDPQAQ